MYCIKYNYSVIYNSILYTINKLNPNYNAILNVRMFPVMCMGAKGTIPHENKNQMFLTIIFPSKYVVECIY